MAPFAVDIDAHGGRAPDRGAVVAEDQPHPHRALGVGVEAQHAGPAGPRHAAGTRVAGVEALSPLVALHPPGPTDDAGELPLGHLRL